ncbi:hypothetical protein J2046_002613 [Rhizobium petrolearium]|nr:hypothetical protein [Neorhizobium petrolearium]
MDPQHAGAEKNAARLLEELWPDHDIGDANLVLDRHEDEPLGRARHLPHQNQAGRRQLLAVSRPRRVAAGGDPLPGEIVAQEAQGWICESRSSSSTAGCVGVAADTRGHGW